MCVLCAITHNGWQTLISARSMLPSTAPNVCFHEERLRLQMGCKPFEPLAGCAQAPPGSVPQALIAHQVCCPLAAMKVNGNESISRWNGLSPSPWYSYVRELAVCTNCGYRRVVYGGCHGDDVSDNFCRGVTHLLVYFLCLRTSLNTIFPEWRHGSAFSNQPLYR